MKWKEYNVKAISNNLRLVFKTKDISKLSKQSYDYLYLLSGFIAHYNVEGFRHHYWDLRELVQDLKDSYDINYPRENADSEQADYYKSKVNVALEIRKLILEFEKEIEEHFALSEKDSDMQLITRLMEKHNIRQVEKK